MVEIMWMIHEVVVSFRPLIYIGGSVLTLLILIIMLLEEINNDKK